MKMEVKNVSFTYNLGESTERRAVKEVSFSIEEGEFIGIIGHTGSGKSSLVQLMNALLIPQEGDVLLDGESIYDRKDIFNVRRAIGMVFQYPEQQLFAETVFEDVAFGPRNLGYEEDIVNELVKDALSAMDISSQYYEKSPFSLSGGEQRRVAIAGVLSMNPQMIILDEPTAGLDPEGRRQLFSVIQKLHTMRNKTILLISHSMEDIAMLSQRILVLDKGRLLLDDVPEKVFYEIDLLESIGLKGPEMFYLIEALREEGFEMPKRGSIYTKEQAKSFLESWL